MVILFSTEVVWIGVITLFVIAVIATAISPRPVSVALYTIAGALLMVPLFSVGPVLRWLFR
jgi:hypothetical protein